jgi:hypothetical protein
MIRANNESLNYNGKDEYIDEEMWQYDNQFSEDTESENVSYFSEESMPSHMAYFRPMKKEILEENDEESDYFFEEENKSRKEVRASDFEQDDIHDTVIIRRHVSDKYSSQPSPGWINRQAINLVDNKSSFREGNILEDRYEMDDSDLHDNDIFDKSTEDHSELEKNNSQRKMKVRFNLQDENNSNDQETEDLSPLEELDRMVIDGKFIEEDKFHKFMRKFLRENKWDSQTVDYFSDLMKRINTLATRGENIIRKKSFCRNMKRLSDELEIISVVFMMRDRCNRQNCGEMYDEVIKQSNMMSLMFDTYLNHITMNIKQFEEIANEKNNVKVLKKINELKKILVTTIISREKIRGNNRKIPRIIGSGIVEYYHPGEENIYNNQTTIAPDTNGSYNCATIVGIFVILPMIFIVIYLLNEKMKKMSSGSGVKE